MYDDDEGHPIIGAILFIALFVAGFLVLSSAFGCIENVLNETFNNTTNEAPAEVIDVNNTTAAQVEQVQTANVHKTWDEKRKERLEKWEAKKQARLARAQ